MPKTRSNKDTTKSIRTQLRSLEKSVRLIENTQRDMLALMQQSNEFLRKLSVCAEMYALPRTNKSLFRAASQRAQERTLEIIAEEMTEAVFFEDHDEFRLHCLAKAGQGCALEFGVYNGYTLSHMASNDPSRKFYGFDSFNGLPEEWTGYLKFDFDRNGIPPEMPKNVELIIGRFEETLSVFADRTERIAFVHVDCDIYSSTKTIFDRLGGKLEAGCVIIFDEYFNYVGFEGHERKAFNEYLNAANRKINWFAYSGQQCAGILL